MSAKFAVRRSNTSITLWNTRVYTAVKNHTNATNVSRNSHTPVPTVNTWTTATATADEKTMQPQITRERGKQWQRRMMQSLELAWQPWKRWWKVWRWENEKKRLECCIGLLQRCLALLLSPSHGHNAMFAAGHNPILPSLMPQEHIKADIYCTIVQSVEL